MLRINQKLSYLLIASTSLLSNVNGADKDQAWISIEKEVISQDSQVIERNCHQCPSYDQLASQLNVIKAVREGRIYELSAFYDYPITTEHSDFKVKKVYDQPCFSTLWGLLWNWNKLWLPLHAAHFSLYETTKDTSGTITCTYIHKPQTGVTTFFQLTSEGPKEKE